MLLSTFILQTAVDERQHRPPDDSLIAAIARGDPGAMQELYASTQADVYGFALSIVKNHDDAEDVMQETYVKIYQAAPAYQAMGKPMAWILTIVKNLALSRLRARGKAALPLEEELEPSVICSPHASVEDKLLLQTAMAALSDEERQIIMLHVVSGLKHREIGQLLDLNLSTVLSKYHRGLKKMKHQLKEA